jgi:hypothetical protein
VFSHAGDDWRVVRDHVRSRLGLTNERRQDRPAIARAVPPAPDKARNTEIALKLWDDAVPLPGTLGEIYLAKHRGIVLSDLEDLSQALRWNERIHALVGLMTGPVTNVVSGVHRTFLDGNGAKTERKMLGRQGVIRLSPDEDVTTSLGVGEGLETTLSLRLVPEFGSSPAWALLSAKGLADFPVLAGIECLWIAADHDQAGLRAAEECARRWTHAGREVLVVRPIRESADLNDLTPGAVNA